MKESDLYRPLKLFLESQNYEVKGEVHSCDVLAVRGEETPVIVELKLILNLDVILQAVDRLLLSPTVYIGVPHDCKSLKRQKKRIVKLLKMLGLGLIVINSKAKKSAVQVLIDPGEFKPRQSKFRQLRLLAEFNKRLGDPNLGGTDTRKGIITAYRQQAIAIANYLHTHGPAKAAVISKSLNDPKVREILYRDVYGWFDRLGKGIYSLSPRGKREISNSNTNTMTKG
ncbi:MAG: hypothetical protein KDD94_14735 [Calditrichaeota bacterium]|nr:hypothetical protein [Calditrichota bacterium]